MARYDDMIRLRRALSGKTMDRGEAKDALFSTFNTLFDLLDHISAMRESMQRMELYILAMVLIIVMGLLGGLGYICHLLARAQEKTVVLSRADSFEARHTKAVIKHHPSDAKL